MSSTNSADQVTQAAQVIKTEREVRQMTLRDFSQALGVSYNAVAMWETGEREISIDRIAQWVGDDRDWVRVMGVRIFAIKYGPMLAAIAQPTQPAPATTAANVGA